MDSNEQTVSDTPNPVVKAIENGTVGSLAIADVRQSLESVGIRSVEELAARLLDKLNREADLHKSGPAPLTVQALRQTAPEGLEAAIEHRTPTVPFVWNGVEHDPADIQRFNGKAIAYIPSQTVTGETRLHILDDIHLVRRWLEAHYINNVMTSFASTGAGTSTPTSRPTDIHQPCMSAINDQPASITVGEHELTLVMDQENPPTWWVGKTLALDPGFWYPDLTQISLEWPWSDWNDTISYIGASRSGCVFFEHINAQGSVLLAVYNNGGYAIPHLTTIGWNDRISCFANTG
jgi:hypothetical protein